MFLPVGDDVDNRSLSIVGVLLITVCTIVFALEFKDSVGKHRDKQAAQQFVEKWGLVPKDVAQGRYVGPVTYIFLHGDLLHIIGNLAVLWAFATSLENYLGAGKLLLLFLLWGVCGGLAHAGMHWGSSVPLVGASGAIAGMIGAYWLAFGGLTKIKTLFWFFGFRTLMIPTPFYVVVWLATQFAGAAESKTPAGIAWYCHLGGFAAGILTTLPFRHRSASVMTLDQKGRVRFEDRPTEARGAEPLPEVTACPFCHTPLAGLEQAAASFVRCPNERCQRLVFLDPELSASV